MRKLITNDVEKCVGCNRCIRVCPVEEANISGMVVNIGSTIAQSHDNVSEIAANTQEVLHN